MYCFSKNIVEWRFKGEIVMEKVTLMSRTDNINAFKLTISSVTIDKIGKYTCYSHENVYGQYIVTYSISEILLNGKYVCINM